MNESTRQLMKEIRDRNAALREENANLRRENEALRSLAKVKIALDIRPDHVREAIRRSLPIALTNQMVINAIPRIAESLVKVCFLREPDAAVKSIPDPENEIDRDPCVPMSSQIHSGGSRVIRGTGGL
jgi:hypothetical protein